MNNLTMMPAFAAGQLGFDWNIFNTGVNVQTANTRGDSSGNGLSVYLPPPPPAPTRTTVQSVASGINSRLNWDQIFGLASQGIAAFGRNPTTQIGGLTVRSIQPSTEQPQGSYNPAATGAQPQIVQLPDGRLMINGVIQGGAGSPGAGVGAGIDGITKWIGENPFLVGGAALGLYLLMKQPPGRR